MQDHGKMVVHGRTVLMPHRNRVGILEMPMNLLLRQQSVRNNGTCRIPIAREEDRHANGAKATKPLALVKRDY